MSHFLDLYARMDDAQSAAVARRLEAGEPAGSLDISPRELVAAIAWIGLGPDGAEGLPLVQAAPARPNLAAIVADEATLAALFPGANRPGRLALAAGLLQILDAWEASHHAAQAADDLGEANSAAAWHMIAHRREPDPGNARYWARRVTPQVAFAGLADRAAPLLSVAPAWANRLVDRAGDWNPAALIDLAGQARAGSPEATLARRLQRLEMLSLLDHSAILGA